MKRPKTIQAKAEAAMKKAVKEVIENHKKSGQPLAVWKNGKTALISVNRVKQ
jgi:hypothetical protein